MLVDDSSRTWDPAGPANRNSGTALPSGRLSDMWIPSTTAPAPPSLSTNVTVMRFSAPGVVSPVGWDSTTVKASLPSRASSSRRVIRTCFEVSSTAKFNIAEAAK